MFSVLTLTSSFIYKFLKKKENKAKKVGVSHPLTQEIDIPQLINALTVSKQVTELRTRLLSAIGEDEKIQEFETDKKNTLSSLTQKNNKEKLKEFLIEKVGKDGKLPSEKDMIEETGLTEDQLKTAKNKLIKIGFLYKENARVSKLNPKFIRDVSI